MTRGRYSNLDGASLRRIAWTYGTAKKGSADEAELRRRLLAKAAEEAAEDAAADAAIGPVIDASFDEVSP